MNTTKRITIQISKEKMELMKQLGLSPQDVFKKGFEEYLRQKYREFNLLDDDDDDDEDDVEYIDVSIVSKSFKEIEDAMINDNDIANN
jgi:hypothetical protein